MSLSKQKCQFLVQSNNIFRMSFLPIDGSIFCLWYILVSGGSFMRNNRSNRSNHFLVAYEVWLCHRTFPNMALRNIWFNTPLLKKLLLIFRKTRWIFSSFFFLGSVLFWKINICLIP